MRRDLGTVSTHPWVWWEPTDDLVGEIPEVRSDTVNEGPLQGQRLRDSCSLFAINFKQQNQPETGVRHQVLQDSG